MLKTYEEYYNDPEIVNEIPAMREIHAIRLMKADEREGLIEKEYAVLVSKRVDTYLANFHRQYTKEQQAEMAASIFVNITIPKNKME